MLRMQDFKCGTHGQFEQMLDINVHNEQERFEAVRSHACPTCGEASPGIWTKAPGMRMDVVHTVEFGGRLHRRDALEEALARDDKKPDFKDAPDFERDFMHRLARATQKELNGELAPASDAIPSDANIDSALAGVDIEKVKESQNQVTEFIRRAELPE